MQQVNLLIDDLRPREEPVTALQTVLAAGVLALVLLSITVFDAVMMVQLERDREAAQSRLTEISAATAKIRGSVSAGLDKKLSGVVEALRTERAQQLALIAAVEGRQGSENKGFSGHLMELAERHESGLWLTSIRLTGGGRHMALMGKSVNAQNVPRFLKRLSGGAAFDGHQFNHFELTVDKEGLVAFTITGPAQVDSS